MDIFIQIILLTVTTLTGYFILKELLSSGVWGLVGATCGLILGYAILKIELKLRDISLKIILGSLTGVVVSLFVANLFVSRLLLALIKDIPITLPIYILFYFIMGYLGFVLGKEKSKTIDLSKVPLFDRLEEDKDIKLLDTSTIIDGRIADICETGFVQGTLVIPQFVLYEIQHIADHQDSVKRTRGRRGLDVLHRLQKQTFLTVRIVDYDFPKLKDVDTKLIALAK
ncbi:MAG TPA: hypothetical protein PKN85_00470, partial [Syntrophorhabdaceae bacterium]|nr:hypothetical protein [Syntrophorhabdaceae bacterium]